MAGVLRSSLDFPPARVDVERRDAGVVVLRSAHQVDLPAERIGDWLETWAAKAAQRTFLAERTSVGQWRRLSYGDALRAARRIGAGLVARGLDADKPIAILAENSIDHALLGLGAAYVGFAVAPISPAYALMSKDFGKLKHIFGVLEPELVWTSDVVKFRAALDAVGCKATPLRELEDPDEIRAQEAARHVRPEAMAKVLFTSGSTGTPKGAINTHRMITANQRQSAAVWPFIASLPPVVVDWLPWNHTFGGNYNFYMVLSSGGTMYIDAGKPAPGLIETSVANLREVSPNMYFNVPRGFELLLPYLEEDAALRRSFFRDLRFVFYAGAALPQNLWARFESLAMQECGGDLAMVSAWGATETAPLVSAVHFPIERAGVIGLPVPGCDIKLVPSDGKLEARVRGPNVFPGYFRDDRLSRAAFDEEGFYRIGDALRFADREAPERGLVFDGRVAEDFKLSSGTWVHAGTLRTRLIAAADPVVQDAVITGHDRGEVGALVFLSAAAKGLDVAQRLREALRSFADESSSSRITRLLVMSEPPSIDANEITDKGYVNQAAVRERRAALVEALYASPPGMDVITF